MEKDESVFEVIGDDILYEGRKVMSFDEDVGIADRRRVEEILQAGMKRSWLRRRGLSG